MSWEKRCKREQNVYQVSGKRRNCWSSWVVFLIRVGDWKKRAKTFSKNNQRKFKKKAFFLFSISLFGIKSAEKFLCLVLSFCLTIFNQKKNFLKTFFGFVFCQNSPKKLWLWTVFDTEKIQKLVEKLENLQQSFFYA